MFRHIAFISLLLHCGVVAAGNADMAAPILADESLSPTNSTPQGVRVFDLHDPGLASEWPAFLASTPMLNEQALPATLQKQLENVVGAYRLLTPAGEPAFFVATYFDRLSEQLLQDAELAGDEIRPMRVCPVFASGDDAPVSKLLATASGLSHELFQDAPGNPERYRFLFLQTEFSHCRFLTTVSRASAPENGQQELIGFFVGQQRQNATVVSQEELRAVIETVGEIEATASFREQWPANDLPDEADVLSFIRLLSLLATDRVNGYAAIPVLSTLLHGNDEPATRLTPVAVADAMALALELRATFRRLAPFPIKNAADLRRAQMVVASQLQQETGSMVAADARILPFLQQFVAGADLLLEPGTNGQIMATDRRATPLVGGSD